MGVKGLWRLILPIGRRISLETLAGKVLAIDASIWLTQFVKALRNAETGRAIPSAHLIGFFRRLCRLRYHGIRPVFVFDGATPEMKRREILLRRRRREKFAKLGADGFQRLAKKLLVENMKKQQKQLSSSSTPVAATASAFAQGFDPGTQEDDRKPPPRDAEKGQSTAEEGEAQDKAPFLPIVAAAAAPALAAEPEVIHVEDASDDDNDWKDPATRTSAKATPEDENDDSTSASSSSREEVDYIGEAFDIDLIANLPASKRKDAIEQAQRLQRLNSRREFMPAAANPLQFSQVQVSNFLKSAKLNQNIVLAAQQAANRENFRDAMASDRTTRVELIRENEGENRSNDSSTRQSQGKRESTVATQPRRRLVRQSADNDKEEEDDDENLFSGETNLHSRVRAIQDDEDDSLDDHHDENFAAGAPAAGGGGCVAVAAVARPPPRTATPATKDNKEVVSGYSVSGGFIERIDLASDSSSSSSGQEDHGGFIKSDPTQLGRGIGAGGFMPSADNEDTSGGIPINPDPAVSTSNATTDDDHDANVHVVKLTRTSSSAKLPTGTTVVQATTQDQDETTDYALAVALQETEDEEAALLLESTRCKLECEGRSDRQLLLRQMRAVGTKQQNSAHPAANDSSNKEDDDSIDWEEGEDSASKVDCQIEDHKYSAAADLSIPELAAAREKLEETEPCTESPTNTACAGNQVQADKASQNVRNAPFDPSVIDLTSSKSTAVAVKVDESLTREVALAQVLQENDDGASAEQLMSQEHLCGLDDTSPWRDRMKKAPESRTETPIDDFSDGDEVEWEEGADEVRDSRSLACNDAPAGADAKIRAISSGRYNGRGTPRGPSNVSTGMLFGRDDSDGNWDSQPHLRCTDETAAALERGLATASNLTNWAGAAFRRAMQAAGQGGSKSTSSNTPTALNTPDKTVVLDEDFEADVTLLNGSEFPSGPAKDSKTLDGTELGEKSVSHLPSPRARLDNSAQPSNNSNSSADLANTLELYHDQGRRWVEEGNKRERDLDTVTDEMREEVIQLLQLFGVPFVEAPAEAEAQCAALEELGLVHGIVTEDSDVFVFGGKTVYKNIFDEQKYTEVYKAEDAAREMNLGRNQMVALAMLLGGDYTAGVNGVGIVNAMEIIETFDTSLGVKYGLEQFKKWLEGIDLLDDRSEFADNVKVLEFYEKHKTARTRWILPEGFPAENVLQAYVNPVVDKSEERFSWGLPDVEKLVLFCQRNIGWSPEETIKLLNPVMDQLRSGFRQTRIDSFMKYEDSIKFADVRSKRLRDVLGLSSADKGDHENSAHDRKQTSKTSKRKRFKM